MPIEAPLVWMRMSPQAWMASMAWCLIPKLPPVQPAFFTFSLGQLNQGIHLRPHFQKQWVSLCLDYSHFFILSHPTSYYSTSSFQVKTTFVGHWLYYRLPLGWGQEVGVLLMINWTEGRIKVKGIQSDRNFNSHLRWYLWHVADCWVLQHVAKGLGLHYFLIVWAQKNDQPEPHRKNKMNGIYNNNNK